MSQSDYLKTQLERIAKDAESTVRLVRSPEFRDKATGDYAGASHYPAASGALEYAVEATVREVTRVAENVVPRIAAMEAEHDRLIAIFEALEIDLDEETLATLELIGKRSAPFKDERRTITAAFRNAIAEVREEEREHEHDEATDALVLAGFVYDSGHDCFNRGPERVVIGMTYRKRTTTYSWIYGMSPLDGSEGIGSVPFGSGTSGEFHRLLALIQRVQVVAE